jgi:L-Ala-D/L-Glu epimerase
MEVRFRRVEWEYKSVFRIAYSSETHARTMLVELQDGALVGRGEAMGVSYHGETVDTMLEQVAGVADAMRRGAGRAEISALLPPGGARNALDCAMWDLEAKRVGRRAWELAGFRSMRPLVTAYTLSVDEPSAMARSAIAAKQCSLLKLKLMGDGDLERVQAVRAARPDVELVVDANQAWSERQLEQLAPRLAKLGVKLIEQPLPVGKDDALAEFASPVPLCADESCQIAQSLSALVGKYQYVNVKLDKTGGLTEALRLARLARAEGLKVMVGCMGGSSLAMAPAFVVAQLSEVVDLDGPLLTKADVPNGIRYIGNEMQVPEFQLWG